MRYGIHVFLLAALAGCAHISRQDQQTGLELTYTGPAKGAVAIVSATDPRLYDLAQKAMDKGMAPSLIRDADGDVRFSAGYGYPPYLGGNVGGYAAPNTGFIPGQGFVVGAPQSHLPPLATSVVTTDGSTKQGNLVVCPEGRSPSGQAEMTACTYAALRLLITALPNKETP
jgi:hypothetical protein